MSDFVCFLSTICRNLSAARPFYAIKRKISTHQKRCAEISYVGSLWNDDSAKDGTVACKLFTKKDFLCCNGLPQGDYSRSPPASRQYTSTHQTMLSRSARTSLHRDAENSSQSASGGRTDPSPEWQKHRSTQRILLPPGAPLPPPHTHADNYPR